MTLEQEIHTIGRRARDASRALARLTATQKNKILIAMADEIMARQDAILAANALDLARAEENGLSKAMIDRLTLDPKRLKAMKE
jgi:glutamate-5-semialdehyde dehydrogenase